MFKDFTRGLVGEELRLIKQLERDLYEANNVDTNMEDACIETSIAVSNDQVFPEEARFHNSYGVMSKNQDEEWIDVTQVQQENNLAQMKMKEFRYRCATCKKLFSCEVGWRKHTEWMS
jgi:sulfatase maturation enzyme AslB (radical SAM superfamily)